MPSKQHQKLFMNEMLDFALHNPTSSSSSSLKSLPSSTTIIIIIIITLSHEMFNNMRVIAKLSIQRENSPIAHTYKTSQHHILSSFLYEPNGTRIAYTHAYTRTHSGTKWQWKRRIPVQTKWQRKSIESFYSSFHSVMVYVWKYL